MLPLAGSLCVPLSAAAAIAPTAGPAAGLSAQQHRARHDLDGSRSADKSGQRWRRPRGDSPPMIKHFGGAVTLPEVSVEGVPAY